MITRAQAEALLTLAESLEACERVGVEMVATELSFRHPAGGFQVPSWGASSVDPRTLRECIAYELPKPTGS